MGPMKHTVPISGVPIWWGQVADAALYLALLPLFVLQLQGLNAGWAGQAGQAGRGSLSVSDDSVRGKATHVQL